MNRRNLIAGYNTSSEEEKAKVDEKKLCRVIGAGMLIITALIFVMAIGASVLPASFAHVSMGIVILDCIVMIILANTICKKYLFKINFSSIWTQMKETIRSSPFSYGLGLFLDPFGLPRFQILRFPINPDRSLPTLQQ